MKIRTGTAAFLAAFLAASSPLPGGRVAEAGEGARTVPRWELGIGAGALSMPDYRGSDQVRNYLLPFPYVVYRLDWVKIDREGIRSKLFRRDWVDLNFSLSASPPVRSRNNRAREGMSDLDPVVELGPSLDLHLWKSADRNVRLDVRLPVRASFTADWRTRWVGGNFTPTVNLDVNGIAGIPVQVGLLAGPVFADARQHRYYYGVPAADARPGRPAYAAHGGYAGTQFLAAVSHRFERGWIGAYGRVDTLKDAVFEDSPLVRRDRYASGGIAAAWIFGQSSERVERKD